MSNAEGAELAQCISRYVVKLSAAVRFYITSRPVSEVDVAEVTDDKLVYYRFHSVLGRM
jgi:hypothetical protein